MKLNLLPTYVGKGRQVTLAIVCGVMVVAAAFGVTTVMISDANKQLAKVKEQAQKYDAPVQAAIDHAAMAETIVAPLAGISRNINLAVAMQQHNSKYPEFYTKIFPTIPDFYRITSMQASPVDGSTVTLRMTGVLKTQEQYRDLMLALLRIPGAQSVTRSGFTPKFSVLPGVTSTDQNPTAPAPGEPSLPKDPLQRLDALIASGQPKPFAAPKGYGDDPGERGPMPDYQEITVTVELKDPAPPSYNLMTPNPSATLGVSASGPGGNGPGGGGGGKRGGAVGG